MNTLNRFNIFLCLMVLIYYVFLCIRTTACCTSKSNGSSRNGNTCNSLYNSTSNNTHTQRTQRNKSILIWNSPHRIETAAFGFGHEPFVKNGCRFKDCVIYDNLYSLPLQEYDAIIVHVHDLWQTHLPNLATKPKLQRLIFLTQESPVWMRSKYDIYKLNNTFNWIMSYRLNSDVMLRYGRIEPSHAAPKNIQEMQKLMYATHLPSAKNFAAKKTNLVAWMASHCETNEFNLRETYVRQLSKFIPVDIYGACGNLACQRNVSHWLSNPECYDMLENKYKFYLSFENSVCTDYVTEKFFEIMNHDIVPVVYGGANYSDLAPLHSYINALDFTPEKLAEYLMVIDRNDTLYNEYFWWKGHYQVEAGVQNMARNGFCDLCKKLHQDEGVFKIYPELVTEWHSSNQCRRFVFGERDKS